MAWWRRNPAPLDPLDARRRLSRSAEHLAAAAPYTHVLNLPVRFDAFHGFADVVLDRVFASASGATLHILTATEHYGRAMLNQCEQIAEILRATDPSMAGLILYWPPAGTTGGGDYFEVVLFDVTDDPQPRGQGRLEIVTEHGRIHQHERAGATTRYANPSAGYCTPDDLAQELGIPHAELAPLMPQIHQMASQTPGWWEAVADVKHRNNTASDDHQAILKEWGLS